MQIAVGGCLAQKDRGDIVKKAPWVDVVFGTHNIGSLPALLERARHNAEAEVEILESLEVFPSTLPTQRESTYAGWVSISVGCNNTCTFCIVPSLRGKEKDRRPGDDPGRGRGAGRRGRPRGHPARAERQLLRRRVRRPARVRQAAARLRRRSTGLERVRFTSPHPKDFTDDVIAAMAETPNVCHSLHMPLQSGSDQVLKAMRRSYRSEKYLGIIDKVRAAMPDAAITTDIIVGFPGETEDDFEQHPRRGPRRPASPAPSPSSTRSAPAPPPPTMDGQLPKQVVQERYERLIATLEEITWAENKQLVGRDGRGAGRGRRGPQGRAHRPDERPRPRRPAGALRDRRADRRPRPATSSRP